MLKGLREFNTYSKQQRQGLILLLGLLAVVVLVIQAVEIWLQPTPLSAAERQEVISKLEALRPKEASQTYAEVNWRRFDPNRVSAQALKEMGLAPYLAERVEKYRASGGSFRQKSDLLKIYGMDSAWYNAAQPYVSIASSREPSSDGHEERTLRLRSFNPNQVSAEALQKMGLQDWQAQRIINYREKYKPFERARDLQDVYGLDSVLTQKLAAHAQLSVSDSTKGESATERATDEEPNLAAQSVALNHADTNELKRVPGIASYTAAKIVEMRSDLGGFHSTEQLLEIWPIDSARLEQLETYIYCEGKVRQLDLNHATVDELAAHPYLFYRVAKNIVAFRERMRLYKSVEEVQNIELVDPVLFRKIAPYLTVGE